MMRLIFAILLLFSLSSIAAADQARGPALYIENTTRDVGTVNQGETIRQTFQFVNKGDRTLEILDVAHS